MKKLTIFLLIFVFPIIVLAYPKGDVNGDNKVTSTDYIAVRKHILKQATLTGDMLKRADLTGDNKITSLDYIAIRKTILGKVQLPTPTPKSAINVNKLDISINTKNGIS